MELTPEQEKEIKSIFSMYDYGTIRAEEALWLLEQLINNEDTYEDLYGNCDTCDELYELSSREGRCGDCGECAEHCDHDTNATDGLEKN